jgi:hypothetical protein
MGKQDVQVITSPGQVISNYHWQADYSRFELFTTIAATLFILASHLADLVSTV